MPDIMFVWLIIIVVAILVAAVFFRYVPLGLWINARASGAPVKIISLIGMRFRRISPQKIVNAYIKARKAGLDVTTDMLETHFLAGGNVERVINALISAKQASINLSFTTACAIDLAGQHQPELHHRLRHRPGGPRRAPGRADERAAQGD